MLERQHSPCLSLSTCIGVQQPDQVAHVHSPSPHETTSVERRHFSSSGTHRQGTAGTGRRTRNATVKSRKHASGQVHRHRNSPSYSSRGVYTLPLSPLVLAPVLSPAIDQYPVTQHAILPPTQPFIHTLLRLQRVDVSLSALRSPGSCPYMYIYSTSMHSPHTLCVP